MKKLKIFFTILITNLIGLIGISQTVIIPNDGCPVNTTSTDPNNYQNNSDPFEERKWNWMANNYTVYLTDNSMGTLGIPFNIVSPFYDASLNPNTLHLAEPFVKDYLPRDGWELLYQDFGTPAQGVRNPYFMLYNRLNGTIRCFANIINSGEFAYNAAMLELTFRDASKKQTAALNQLGKNTFSFMNFQPNAEHFIPNNYINSGINNNYFWVYADFNTLYDPCTCGLESNIVFKVALISQIDVNLSVSGQITSIVDAVDATNTQVNNNDFFSTVQRYLEFGSGAINGLGEINTSGKKAYKDGNDMVADAQQNVLNLQNMIGKERAKNIARSLRRLLYELPKVNQMLSMASTAITVVRRLSGQAAELNGGSVEDMKGTQATQFNTSLTVTGSLELNALSVISELNLPGAMSQSSIVNQRPVYNNILGVVNLIEQPEISKKIYNPQNVAEFLGSPGNISTFITLFYSPITELRISKEPQITVNPASGLKLKSVDYQLVFTNVGGESTSGSPSTVKTHKLYGPILPGISPYFLSLDHNFTSLNDSEREDLYTNMGYELNARHPTGGWDGAVFSTPYFNQSCFTKTNLLSFSGVENVTVRAKIILEPIDKTYYSETEEVIFIYSYIPKITETTSSYQSISQINGAEFRVPVNGFGLIYGKPADLLLQNEIITKNIDVIGDLTIANDVKFAPGNYTLKATGNIYIEKSLVYLPDALNNIDPDNYNINLIAGNNIETLPEAVLLPNVVLSINPALQFPCESEPTIEASNSVIKQLCSTTKYAENSSKSLIDEISESNGLMDPNDASPLNFTPFPNPASESATIKLNATAAANVQISLSDITGKQHEVAVTRHSGQEYKLNVASLAKGIYFVKVSTLGETKTKQLIIN